MSYGDPDTALLQSLSDSSSDREAAIDAANAEINSALASSPRQYVVPVVVAGISDATLQAQVEARLDALAEALAAYRLSSAGAGTGRKVQKDWDVAQDFLKRVASGKLEFYGLPTTGGRRFLTIVGTREGSFPDAFFDAQERLIV